jgi:hypothetical protein
MLGPWTRTSLSPPSARTVGRTTPWRAPGPRGRRPDRAARRRGRRARRGRHAPPPR